MYILPNLEDILSVSVSVAVGCPFGGAVRLNSCPSRQSVENRAKVRKHVNKAR